MAFLLLPTTEHLSGDLSTDGSWSNQPFQPCYLFDTFGFLLQYSSAAEDGAPKFRVVWKDADGNEAVDIRLIDFTSSPPNVTSTGGYDVVQLSPPGLGEVVSAAIRVTNPGGMTGVRLEAAEAGSLVSPGNVLVTVQASRG